MASNGLRIIQLNMHGSKLVSSELRTKIDRNNIDLLLLQEPYAWKNRVVGLGAQTRVITGNKPDEKPWAAIVSTSRGLTILRLQHLSNAYCVCIEISIGIRSVYFISAYFRFSENIDDHLQHLDSVLRQLRGRKVVLGIDSNAKSHQWYSGKVDNRGRKLEAFLAEHNLLVANEPNEPTTYSSSIGDSNIDVTLETINHTNVIAKWTVLDEWTSSDHRAILIECAGSEEARALPGRQRPWRYALGRANWEMFDESMKRLWDHEQNRQPTTKEETFDLINSIERTVRKACDRSMPRKKYGRTKTVPWWTLELTNLKRKAYRSRRSFQRCKDPTKRAQLKIEYAQERRLYRIAVEKTKLKSWKEFVGREGNLNPWGIIYRMQSNKLNTHEALCSIRTINSYALNWKSAGEVVLRTVVPDDTALNDSESQSFVRLNSEIPPDTGNCQDFDKEEVHTAIKQMKDGKAPGADNIETAAIKRSWPLISDALTNAFNGCLEWGFFPEQWKKGKIILIPKGADRDPSDPRSYRPISLLPTLGKILERLILRRLQHLQEQHGSDRQFGFKPGLSTEDAIVSLRSKVAEKKEKHVLGIFLDVAGAFDNVWWPSVLNELKSRGCEKNLYTLIQDYFKSRTVFIQENEQIVKKIVTKGCPQGSILGPFMWNLIFDANLQAIVETRNLDTIAYADDQVLIIAGNYRREVECRARLAIKIVTDWCHQHKLSLSAEKTYMMMLKGNPESLESIDIKINDVGIKLEDKVKYLGIEFEKGLKVNSHIKRICEKSKNIFHSLGRVAQNKWGLGHKAMLTIYKGVYVPIVTYAANGWADKMTVNMKKALASSQRLALIRVTKAYRTVSTDCLPVVAGVLPIDLEIQKRVIRYKIRRKLDFSIEEISIEWTADGKATDGLTATDVNKRVEGKIYELWQDRWTHSTKGRMTFNYFETVQKRSKSPWIYPNFFVTQFLTGHGSFNSKLNELNIVANGNCSCGQRETPEHMLFQCAQYDIERIAAAEELKKQNIRELTMSNLIKNKKTFQIFAKYARTIMEKRNHRNW